MDDSRTGRPGNEDDEFNDALDDLFGEQPAPAQPPEPSPEYVPPPQPQSVPQFTYPSQVPPASPQSTGRTFTRVLLIGCVSIVGFLVACFVILVIIGILFGDPDATGAGMSVPAARLLH